MTTPPAILLDADMVLLDYITQFERYMAERHGIVAAIPFAAETAYHLPTMYPTLATDDGLVPYLQAMAQDADYYGAIPFLPGVEEGLAALRAAFPNTPQICVTSCGAVPLTRCLRLANLAPLGLDEVITLPLRAAKADALARFAPGCWFVDDIPGHVAEAEAAGHTGILFHQVYNVTAPVRRRAHGWPDVVEHILGSAPAPARAFT